jgi:hypothetical protein
MDYTKRLNVDREEELRKNIQNFIMFLYFLAIFNKTNSREKPLGASKKKSS